MKKIEIIVFHKKTARTRTIKKKFLHQHRYLFLEMAISLSIALARKQRATSRNQR